MHGRRDISIPLSIKLDAALGFAPGTLAQAQTRDQVKKEMQRKALIDMDQKKHDILEAVKEFNVNHPDNYIARYARQ